MSHISASVAHVERGVVKGIRKQILEPIAIGSIGAQHELYTVYIYIAKGEPLD